MNNERRKKIEGIQNELMNLIDLLEEISAEEQEAYDNLPEGIQASEKGEKMDEARQLIEDATEAVRDANNMLGETL